MEHIIQAINVRHNVFTSQLWTLEKWQDHTPPEVKARAQFAISLLRDIISNLEIMAEVADDAEDYWVKPGAEFVAKNAYEDENP